MGIDAAWLYTAVISAVGCAVAVAGLAINAAKHRNDSSARDERRVRWEERMEVNLGHIADKVDDNTYTVRSAKERIDGIARQVERLEGAHDRLEGRVDDLETVMAESARMDTREKRDR